MVPGGVRLPWPRGGRLLGEAGLRWEHTGDRASAADRLQRELRTPLVHGWKRRLDHPSLYHSQVLLITWLFGLFYALSPLQSTALGDLLFPHLPP